MYPNQSYTGYHANAMGSWNKANVPQNSQGIGYAFSYTHPELTSYVEKAAFPNPYGAVYPTAENDYYRQHYANPGSQPTQWMQSNLQQYVPAMQYRRLTDCYNRHCPNMPNTARPPPTIKPETIDNTFHASLSMLENPTQNSAAAYTANWVSSTSSIPPELRDEPEVPSFNVSAHNGCRDDLAAGASAVFTPPASSLAEQFSNLSVHEKQWPGLGQGKDGGGIPASQGGRRRTEGRERRVRHSPKELTWEERIKKGAVQKERIEQRGLEKPERTERDGRESNSGSGRHKGQRGGRCGVVARSDRAEREPLISPIPGEGDFTTCRNQVMVKGTRIHGSRQGDKKYQVERKPRVVPFGMPQYYRHGTPLMMPQSAYYNTGPNLVPCVAQQDQRFKNTWLDANLGINYNSVQMVDYAALAPCGNRPRPPSRGRSGYRFLCKNSQNAKESSKTRSDDRGSSYADQDEEIRTGVEKGDSSKMEEEEWGVETTEEKQKRHDGGVYWPFERDRPEKECAHKDGKFDAVGKDFCSTNSTPCSIEKPEASDTSLFR